ncbi:hypothetical protein C8A05DRAFT_39854, partial [Staphylotrichum tortipilum]
MFGPPRRRPLLNTALVIGASRASARREVERQTAAQAQREYDVQRAAEQQMRLQREEEARIHRAAEEKQRKKEEEDERVRKAVEEAVAKNTLATQQGQQAAGYYTPPPPPPMGVVPGMGMPGDGMGPPPAYVAARGPGGLQANPAVMMAAQGDPKGSVRY